MTGAIDRRRFVSTCACAGAGMLLGCVSMVTHPVPVTDGRVRIALARFPELATPAGAIKLQPAQLPDPIYVLATGEGQFGAVSPICTHRGCTVDVEGDRLVCPCHGSTYNRSGEVLRGPAQRRLTRYAVTREDGDLVIDLASAT